MTVVECPHEADVLSAVYTNRWPSRVDADLHAHVQQCAICADVVTVAAAFETECNDVRADMRVNVQVPDSGAVWWRMQMRARQDAMRVAVRPITVTQAVSLAVALGLMGAIFGATATWFQQILRSLAGLFAASFVSVKNAMPTVVTPDATTSLSYGLVFVAITVCVMLTPVAVYLVTRED